MILEEKYALSNGVEIPKLGLETGFINNNAGNPLFIQQEKFAYVLQIGSGITVGMSPLFNSIPLLAK